MIEVQLPGQLLILTPGEVTSLLAMKPELWEKALKRGKHEKRRRQARDRAPKHIKAAEMRLAKLVADRCQREP